MDIKNNDAIKQGISNYLAKRPDLLSMDVNVGNVVYKGDEATATVHFQAKGNNTPGGGMTMQYVLTRQGNLWVVRGKAAGESHGEGMGMPQGPGGGSGSMGAMPNTPAPGSPGALPPGHPAVGESSGQLPPGHPTIPDKKTGQSK